MNIFQVTILLQSDFYMYDITSGRWTLITEDTHTMGGPRLIYDHQMVIDIQKQTLYLFGGRVLSRYLTYILGGGGENIYIVYRYACVKFWSHTYTFQEDKYACRKIIVQIYLRTTYQSF